MAFVKFLFRLIAAILIMGAIVSAIIDITKSVASEQIVLTPLGLTWRTFSPSTLQQAEFAVQQYISPAAWFDWAVPLLQAPTAAVLTGLALLFMLLGWPRRKKREVNLG